MVDDPNLFDICCASDVTFSAQGRSILFRSQKEIADKKFASSISWRGLAECVCVFIGSGQGPFVTLEQNGLWQSL